MWIDILQKIIFFSDRFCVVWIDFPAVELWDRKHWSFRKVERERKCVYVGVWVGGWKTENVVRVGFNHARRKRSCKCWQAWPSSQWKTIALSSLTRQIHWSYRIHRSIFIIKDLLVFTKSVVAFPVSLLHPFIRFFFQPQDFLLNYYMKHGQPFPNSGPHERWFIIRRVELMKKKNQMNFWLKVKRPFSLPKIIRVRIYLRIGGKN